ncbi:MAG: serine/threonine protein kinase [Deltaproteobacteria bacterium]|nr:serine/threonine protein kinase [Deltaproteobacteria bacterium]
MPGRDPTQSLSLDEDELDDEPSHPSLALGTADAQRREQTRVESPGAQKKAPSGHEVNASGRHRPPPMPGPKENPGDHLGQILGSYKILDLLGKGGMGYVFRAEHVKLGREVALKLLRSDYAKRRDAVARFFQEARTVNRVRHRNIVDVTDFVELDDGTTFIIMELLGGVSLGKWARSGVDLPRALAVLVQICDGLGAAHNVGVVHRDLKPDNIIVVPTSDGAELAKLLDFGVAKLLNRDDEDVGFQTAAGSVIGTPAYMSPEQAGGMLIDARSDIYSLGAIMYELFCGQPMFRGRSFGEYVRKHLTEMPTPPRQTGGGAMLEPRLEVLIMKCLEKDPGQRFGHILELRDALLNMLGGMEIHSPTMSSLTASAIRPPPQAQTYVPHAMATILPSAPIPHHQTPASGMHPSAFYNQYASQLHGASQIAVPPPQSTPWWVWFVGGAVAVGLGIGAAVWYAGRNETPTLPVAIQEPKTQPVVTQPEPPPLPKLVELKFDSLPSGGVYEDGTSAELCKTPCTFNVPSTELRRTYVVRADGYKDMSVVVDLENPKRAFKLTLEERAVAVVEPVPDTTKTKTPIRPGKQPIKKTVKSGDKKPEPDKPDPTATKPDPKPDTNLIDPDDGKPKKPDPKKPIDPTDLADPFKRKR